MVDQATGHAAIELRKERVHTTMLIELLALLIFLAMAFAFVLRDEGDRANPWKEKHDRVLAQLHVAEKEIADLHEEVRSLELKVDALQQSLRRFMAARANSLPANDQVLLSRRELDRLTAALANAEAVVKEQARDNATLQARLNGGRDLPPCTVTAGFLLRVDLLGDGQFRAQPAWTPGSADAVRAIPGVMTLTSGHAMTGSQLTAQTRTIQRWATSQTPKCQFRVQAVAAHNNAQLFNRQVGILEQTFYVARRTRGAAQ